MKKTIIALLCSMAFVLSACGSSEPSNGTTNKENEKTEVSTPETSEEQEVLDLQGTWVQTNSGADDSWQEAVILGDYMEVYWVTDNGDSRSLYWAGSYDAPTEGGDTYSWTSENDKDKTDYAMLASGDDTKKINYKKGEISYTVSMMGQSSTIRLERTDDTGEFAFGGRKSSGTGVVESSGSGAAGNIVGSGTADESGIYFSSMPDDRATIIDNIDVEAEYKGDRMIVMLTNNNAFVIPDLDITVVFYKNGSMVDSDTDGHDVFLPGSTIASKVDVPSDTDEYKINVEVDWKYATNYRNWANDVSIESNIGDGNVMIQFTNNSETDIEELEYIVAYYKNGEFVYVGWPKDVSDFNAGSTIVEKDEPYGVDFDDYRIFINQAHTFGF